MDRPPTCPAFTRDERKFTLAFFRPVLAAVALPWHFVLPLDPFAYHCRNFAFCALNLLLLHRVYYQEPLAGIAIGLALGWKHLGARLRGVWTLALVLIALNGALGNPVLENHFAYAGGRAAAIQEPVAVAHRGESLDTITFVTRERPFWSFTLAGSDSAMMQELMGLRWLKVRVIDRTTLPSPLAEADARNLFFDADAGFAPIHPAAAPPR